VKRKGVTVRWGLKEAWSETATRRTGTGYEAAWTGTSGPMTAKSSSIEEKAVNPAGVRGRLSNLPREVCAVSTRSRNHRGFEYRVTGRVTGVALRLRERTEVAVRRPDRGAEVSRGHSRRGNELGRKGPEVSPRRRPERIGVASSLSFS
jgi:hypothetical protein